MTTRSRSRRDASGKKRDGKEQGAGSSRKSRSAHPKRRASPRTLIRKSSGDLEPFSRYKFRRSLRRSGAAPDEIRHALDRVEEELRPGIRSRDVFRIARDALVRESPPVAAQYSLKKAVMALGPTGFPFERLVAAVLTERGYRARTSVVVRGRCVSHEVDIVATLRRERILAECKFHAQPSFKTDVRVSLYVAARARDIREKPRGRGFTEFWLVTNTRFTTDARRVAVGNGLRAISWEHPAKGNLNDMIRGHGLHPITCLTSISMSRKRMLLERGMVLCRELRSDASAWHALGLNPTQEQRVRAELDGLEQLALDGA